MSERAKTSLSDTLTGVAPLPEELRRAPRERQRKKVRSSLLGLFIMATALPMFALAGYLALRPNPSLVVLGGAAAVATFWFAAGAIITDPETVGPVLRGLAGIILRARKSK